MHVPILILSSILLNATVSPTGGIWPANLHFEARTASEDRMMFSLVDDSGQVFQHWFRCPRGEWTVEEAKVLGTEWHNVFGGADDGIIHFPVRKITTSDGAEIRGFTYDEFPASWRPYLSIGENTADGAPVPVLMTSFGETDPFASGPRKFYSPGTRQTIEDGRIVLDFSRMSEVQFYSHVPVWGQPRGFRLTVEAPVEAAGLEFEVILTSCAFTRLAGCPVQRLRDAAPGETSIRQTFEIPAPFSDGWTDVLRADHRPRSKRPGPGPAVTKLIIRKGSALSRAFEIRLLKLESLSRPGVNRPPLMAEISQSSGQPREIKVGFLNLDARKRENCSVRVIAEDWSGRKLMTVVKALPQTRVGGRAFVEVGLGSLPKDIAFVSFRCELLENGIVDGSVCPTEVSWIRPLPDAGSPQKRPDLPWGMGVYLHRNTDPYGYHSSYVSAVDDAAIARMEERAALARRAGFKWERVELQAFRVVPKRDVYDFTLYDRLLEIAERHGLSCVMNLGTYIPSNLDRRSEEGQRRYVEMVRRTVARYKDRVHHWEVWNEPEYASFWNGTRQEFVRFSNAIHDAIKEEDPTAEVIACATAHVDVDFIDKCKADGIRYDSFSVHPYRDFAEANGLVADLSAVTNRSAGARTWVTEIGWSTSSSLLGCAATEREQASRLARAYMVAAGSGCVNAVFGYCFVDNGFNRAGIQENFGIVRRDGSLKPAYRALARVCRTFTEGTPSLSVERLKSGASVCVFRMGGKSAVWPNEESRMSLRVALDGCAKARNLMGEPIGSGDVVKVSIGASDVAFFDRDVVSVDEDDAGDMASARTAVNPFIGTAASGHCNPGAARPFAMVQPGPDTGTGDWRYCAGYQYKDTSILGFSQNHLCGTGQGEMGDVLLLPFCGEEVLRGSSFSHVNETATPGYYSVTLDEANVRAELTSTERVACHRYTYLGGGRKRLLVDLQHGLVSDSKWAVKMTLEGRAEFSADGFSMSGTRLVEQYWPRHRVFFHMVFSRPVAAKRLLGKEHEAERGERWLGKEHEAERGERWLLDFDMEKGETLEVKVALSYTSAEGARRNMAAEAPTWDFDGIRRDSARAWDEILSRIEIDGATSDERAVFYTSLYHLCYQPNVISDVGDRLRYSTFSFWDTYRAAHPLYTLLTPERVDGFIASILDHARTTGQMPIWEIYGQEGYDMIASHSIPVVMDAWRKGFDVDLKEFYPFVKHTLTTDNRAPRAARLSKPFVSCHWDKLDKLGFFPCDVVTWGSVSRIMETTLDDWCAAEMAKELGLCEDEAFFRSRSRCWRNSFKPGTGWVCPRLSDGKWLDGYDPAWLIRPKGFPAGFCADTTEGSGFQWSFHVLHDVPGLVDVMGGRDKFLRKLDFLFSHKPYWEDDQSLKAEWPFRDASGTIGEYSHGNEPCHHVAYLYSLAGARKGTAERARAICRTQYANRPDGVCGNDDCGQMGAWYVFAAMGFYPVNPAAAEYVAGEPLFQRLRLSLPVGRTLDIRKGGDSGITLGGKPVQGTVLRHSDLVKGGVLEFGADENNDFDGKVTEGGCAAFRAGAPLLYDGWMTKFAAKGAWHQAQVHATPL